MSVGHDHKHKLTRLELDDLLDEALSNSKVKALLDRQFDLVTTKDIPLLGSSSVSGNVYLDRHLRYRDWPFGVLPLHGKRFDTRRGLIRHERMERIIEDVFGWPYMPIAHPVATHYEHRLYREMGLDPAEVEALYRPYIRRDETEPLLRIPTDLDLRPMLDDKKLLERTRTDQERQKREHKSVGYVVNSTKPNQKCSLCVRFIADKFGGPACEGVKSPISPDGWCRRFKRGSMEHVT